MDASIDILALHDQMVARFQEEMTQLPLLEQRLTNLCELERTVQHASVRKSVIEDRKALQERITSLRDGTEYSFYLLSTMDVLETYKRELRKPIRVNFMGDHILPDQSIKQDLVRQYMAAIRPFGITNIHGTQGEVPGRTKTELEPCESCFCNTMCSEGSTTQVCESCGWTREVAPILFSYRDNDRVNMSGKYTYDRSIHFRECINQFQGKQQRTIPESVYAHLYEQIRLHSLEMPGTTREERYRNVTKRHLYHFLKETKNAKHYEDINLIYHTITGAKLDDISHLEEVLIKDFNILNELYIQMFIKTKRIERKNFISTQYVLFQLLRRHKYPCKQSDFNFLKTTEPKSFLDTICAEMFEHLNWNFTSIF